MEKVSKSKKMKKLDIIFIKMPAKQSYWGLSTKIKFDQNICLHENRNLGKVVSVFLLVF